MTSLETTASGISVPLYVDRARTNEWIAPRKFVIRKRRSFSINLVVEGTMVFVENGARHVAHEGDAILGHKGNTHTYETEADTDVRTCFVLLEGALLPNYLTLTGLDRQRIIPARDYRSLLALFRRALDLVDDHGEQSLLERSTLAHRILIELAASAPDRRPDALRKAIQFIEINLHRTVSREEVCAVACLSARQCSRMFKEYLRKGPIEYARTRRLTHAANLLKGGDRSVGEVAHEVGYESPRDFATAFKREHGVSPRSFQMGHAIDL